MAREIKGTSFNLEIPNRFDFTRRNYAEAVKEVDQMAAILVRGTEALSGLYLRICDRLRDFHFSDDEVRQVLAPHFPAPRISEFIRVVNAPDAVYRRYRLGVVGFKAVLLECRGYTIHTTDELRQKKIRRTAERLVNLLGQGEVEVKGRRVTII